MIISARAATAIRFAIHHDADPTLAALEGKETSNVAKMIPGMPFSARAAVDVWL